MEECSTYFFHCAGKVADCGCVYEFGGGLVALGLVDIGVGSTVDDGVY